MTQAVTERLYICRRLTDLVSSIGLSFCGVNEYESIIQICRQWALNRYGIHI